MAAELTAAGGVTQRATGSGGIAFKIEGTTSDPKFVPDVSGMAGNAARKAISGSTGTKGEPTKGLGGLLKKTF